MKLKASIFLLLWVIIYTGCSDDDIIVDPQGNLFIKEIIPENPYTGQTLKIVLNRNVDFNGYDKNIFFNGNWSYADSCKNDTIYTFLPLLKGFSKVNVSLRINENSKLYELQKKINIDEICNKNLCVIENDEGVIKKGDCLPVDYSGMRPEWSIDTKNDTVIIKTNTVIADESNQEITIKFLNNGSLPKFISYVRTRNFSNGSTITRVVTDTLKSCLIKIGNWNNSGLYSGKIYAELEPFESTDYFPPRTVFWVQK